MPAVMNRLPPSRPHAEPRSESHTVAREIARLTDGLTRLLTETLNLAKLEVVQAARKIALNGAIGAVFATLVLIGYLLACVAGALALAPVTGTAPAFAVVGGANVLIGAIGGIVVWRSISDAARHF